MKNLLAPPPYPNLDELARWCNDLYEHLKYPIVRSAFRARSSTTPNLAIDTVHYPFDTELFDINGDYDPSASPPAFTVPVNGIYVFDAVFSLGTFDTGATSYEFYIQTSSTGIIARQVMEPLWTADFNFTVNIVSGVANLVKDETVYAWMRQNGGSAVTDMGNVCTFSGFLLQHN